jgi:hypothetical protein
MSKAEELSGFDFARLADVRALKPGLLYPYQSDGVAFLLSKKRAVLGDDMGLGKTRQAIVSMQMGAPEGKILVVCPAALKLNWRREILLVDPDGAVEVIGSTIPAADDMSLANPGRAKPRTGAREQSHLPPSHGAHASQAPWQPPKTTST